MIGDAIRTRLLTVAGVSALVGATRVYPAILPQPPVFSAITYQHVSERRANSFAGPIGLPGTRMRVDCWANTYTDAEALADQVRLALDGWQGTSAGKVVQASILEGQEYIFEDETRTHRFAQDYVFFWNETP